MSTTTVVRMTVPVALLAQVNAMREEAPIERVLGEAAVEEWAARHDGSSMLSAPRLACAMTTASVGRVDSRAVEKLRQLQQRSRRFRGDPWHVVLQAWCDRRAFRQEAA